MELVLLKNLCIHRNQTPPSQGWFQEELLDMRASVEFELNISLPC